MNAACLWGRPIRPGQTGPIIARERPHGPMSRPWGAQSAEGDVTLVLRLAARHGPNTRESGGKAVHSATAATLATCVEATRSNLARLSKILDSPHSCSARETESIDMPVRDERCHRLYSLHRRRYTLVERILSIYQRRIRRTSSLLRQSD